MKRRQKKLLNVIAVLLLGFALYLSFFSKDLPDRPGPTPQQKVTKN